MRKCWILWDGMGFSSRVFVLLFCAFPPFTFPGPFFPGVFRPLLPFYLSFPSSFVPRREGRERERDSLLFYIRYDLTTEVNE